jgi:adenosylmethionine-8-amino-7-oxononanoate aminotransferase
MSFDYLADLEQSSCSLTLIKRDLNSHWHPCSQMKDYEHFAPLIIEKAEGPYLYTADGRQIIDAISSWWCKSLGHGHPRLKAALQKQIDRFEHVIAANTTNETIVNLSEMLCRMNPGLDKVFYASDGSCAVEIALKMCMQARQIRGQTQRTRFMALENGYHGETLLALSMSDLGLYRKPFDPYCIPCEFLRDVPYVCGMNDPLWQDCSAVWPNLLAQLEKHATELNAVIVEPIIQGAGGMRIYSADFLRRLAQWCREHDVYLIADEIMTGFGRSGKMFAYQYADMTPDLLCLGKGLTAGMLPLSAVLVPNHFYNLFYDDYASYNAFMHSHTYSGHALAASVALASLQLYQETAIAHQAGRLGQQMFASWQKLATEFPLVNHLRGLGALCAADLQSTEPRLGYRIFQHAVAQGALLRPLGNTLYWLPPLNSSMELVEELEQATRAALRRVSF